MFATKEAAPQRAAQAFAPLEDALFSIENSFVKAPTPVIIGVQLCHWLVTSVIVIFTELRQQKALKWDINFKECDHI